MDRAFRIECFYMESDKTVSASFDVRSDWPSIIIVLVIITITIIIF